MSPPPRILATNIESGAGPASPPFPKQVFTILFYPAHAAFTVFFYSPILDIADGIRENKVGSRFKFGSRKEFPV